MQNNYNKKYRYWIFVTIPDKELYLLITNNHVIDELYLEKEKKIVYIISKKKEK